MTNTPNKTNIRKWVDALRSGDYKQATGQLRDGDGMCCLGVACDISGLGSWSSPGLTDPPEYLEDAALLPPEVRIWLGLDRANPLLRTEGGEKFVASTLNDTHGYSFNDIADAIERTYLTA